MMPVGRLMQKGPRKRHLAAEACTTMGPPTRERFRLLLGPPLYTNTYNKLKVTPTVQYNHLLYGLLPPQLISQILANSPPAAHLTSSLGAGPFIHPILLQCSTSSTTSH